MTLSSDRLFFDKSSGLSTEMRLLFRGVGFAVERALRVLKIINF
jgi:hypothetical protein